MDIHKPKPWRGASLQAARTGASDISQLGQDILATARRAGHRAAPVYGCTS